MNHNLSREFTKEINGENVQFHVLYDVVTHQFTVTENQSKKYTLMFNPASKSWSTSGDSQPSIDINELATAVQQSFGVFV